MGSRALSDHADQLILADEDRTDVAQGQREAAAVNLVAGQIAEDVPVVHE